MKKSRLLGVIFALPSILLSHQAYAAAPLAQGDPLTAFLPLILIPLVIVIVYYVTRKYKKASSLAIISVSLLWCMSLLLQVKTLYGQKVLIISGSIIDLSKNVYLSLWLVGVFGICLGCWLLYSSINKKKCPMCAEPVMCEAKLCKHCGYEFKIE